MSSIYFGKLVSFYRGLGRPSVANSQFEFRGKLGGEYETLKDLWASHDVSMGSFDLTFDGNNYDTQVDTLFPEKLTEQTDVVLIVSLPAGDCQFVTSLNEFLGFDNNLNTGGIVENVYLVAEDFLFGEKSTNDSINNALLLSSFISELYELASYHDRMAFTGLLKLVFIDTGSDNGKVSPPIVIEPKITIENIIDNCVNLDLFKTIKESSIDNAHILEKKSMFRVSVIEILKDIESDINRFDFLIKHWDLLIETYNGNFECYLTNFSFIKQKKEAAENYMAVSTKISTTLSSISGKLFGLPISLGVAIAILKSSEKFESVLTLIGVAITSMLILFTIKDQRKVLSSIRESIDALFSHTKSSKSGELSNLIAKYKEQLYKQTDSLNSSMVLLMFFSALPFLLSLLAFVVKFEPGIIRKFDQFISIFMCQLLS